MRRKNEQTNTQNKKKNYLSMTTWPVAAQSVFIRQTFKSVECGVTVKKLNARTVHKTHLIFIVIVYIANLYFYPLARNKYNKKEMCVTRVCIVVVDANGNKKK